MLQPGQALLHYRIGDKVGQGGMGEVWAAVDTKLDRKVAIKVLPEGFSADPERLQRFEREAKLLASLSHANIATLHDIEQSGDLRFLVMEFVEGEDLAQRLTRGPMDADECVAICVQIAAALETAHDNGVIHRDLKPANVKLTPEGQVKVLDFGLAKAMDTTTASGNPSSSFSPTVTSANTLGGVILGTAAYMSPEQAKGTAVDRRADVWSFGAVLFEMLTARQPFQGETVSETLASVLKDEPDLDAVPDDTPDSLRQLLRRCLRKDPRRRLQSIGEARLALEHPDEVFRPRGPDPAEVSVSQTSSRLPWVVAGIALVALLLVALWPRQESTAAEDPVRVRVSLAGSLDFNSGIPFDLSRDGRSVVYVERTDGGRRLRLRRMAEPLSQALQGTEGAARPFFSYDGTWVAFSTGGTLKKVSTAGGAPLTLCEARTTRGGTWGPDGTIVISPSFNTGLFTLADTGGEPKPLTTLEEGERSHRWPSFLPDGSAVLMTSLSGVTNYSDATIELVDVESGERTVLHRGGSMGKYVPTGHVLFVRERTMFALPFDAGRREVLGDPMPLMEDVSFSEGQGDGWVATSDVGTYVYRTGSRLEAESTIIELSMDGTVSPLIDEADAYSQLTYSPDGSRLAFAIGSGSEREIWIYDLERGDRQRLTFYDGRDSSPLWAPDGRRVVFSSDRSGTLDVYSKSADGSGETEPLSPLTETFLSPSSWSPDGSKLLLVEYGGGRSGDILVLDTTAEGGDGIRTLLGTEFLEFRARVSPDGAWFAYASDESGRNEAYVQPFPDGGTKTKVSKDGIVAGPYWSPDGRKIYYSTQAEMMMVPMTVEDSRMRAGKPVALFAIPSDVEIEDLSPDGTRFLAERNEGDQFDPERRRQLDFAFNGFPELRRER